MPSIFLNEAFRHCKAIAFDARATAVLENTALGKKVLSNKQGEEPSEGVDGVVVESNAKKLATRFILAIGQHRFWDRETSKEVPA